MRGFTLFLMLVILGTFGFTSSVTPKIQTYKKDLKQTKSAKKETSRKLDQIAKDMMRAEKDLEALEHKLDLLKEDKQKSERMYNGLKGELATSTRMLKEMAGEIEEKKALFMKLLAEQFSMTFAMDQFNKPTKESIISKEIYRVYKEQNMKELTALKGDIAWLKKAKKNKKIKHDKIKKSIAMIVIKRKMYIKKKKTKERLVEKLRENEEKYQKKLENLVDRQSSLRGTLSRLNILHKKEVEEARKRAAARREAIRLEKERLRKIRKAKALAKKRERLAQEAIRRAKTKKAKEAAMRRAKRAREDAKIAQEVASRQSVKVRKVNSSYKQSKTYAYRGQKTISPLIGAKLVKKFGTYIDPIYKIKIFNESVTLKAPSTNAKVRNVLNGKVVFFGKSSMLGRVVVVAHSNRLHTVYAGLSKISPTIRMGRKIKKGYVVGKVQRKLLFQATKNSKHINPMRLIHI